MSDEPITAMQEKLAEYISASQTFLAVRSADYVDVELDLRAACGRFNWDLWFWDSYQGLETSRGVVDLNPRPAPPTEAEIQAQSNLPPALTSAAAMPQPPKLRGTALLIAALTAFKQFDNRENLHSAVKKPDDPRRATILVIRDLHRYWRPGHGPRNDDLMHDLIVLLRHFLIVAATEAKFLIGLMPDCEAAKVPAELEAEITVVRHRSPSKAEFRPIIETIDTDTAQIVLTSTEMDMIAEASCGLTRQQAAQAYCLAAARYVKVRALAQEANSKAPAAGNFYAGVVEEIKNEILNADGTLIHHHGKENFNDIGGNDAAKEYLMRLMDPRVRKRAAGRNPRLNAATFIGPSGSGKTLLAKALGTFARRNTYGANLSSQKSKWMGESEANARKMFERASAMSNIVLYFDEFNEQIEGGEGEGHATDKALRQYLMEWLDTHYKTDDVFVVLTANRITNQHMGLYRRLGKIYYVGHPGQAQKQQIWTICARKHGLEDKQFDKLPDDTGWVGEDIDACCAFAAALQISVSEAASNHVIPSSNYASANVTALQEAADGVCFDAETGKIYRKDKETPPEATGSLRVKRKIRTVQ